MDACAAEFTGQTCVMLMLGFGEVAWAGAAGEGGDGTDAKNGIAESGCIRPNVTNGTGAATGGEGGKVCEVRSPRTGDGGGGGEGTEEGGRAVVGAAASFGLTGSAFAGGFAAGLAGADFFMAPFSFSCAVFCAMAARREEMMFSFEVVSGVGGEEASFEGGGEGFACAGAGEALGADLRWRTGVVVGGFSAVDSGGFA